MWFHVNTSFVSSFLHIVSCMALDGVHGIELLGSFFWTMAYDQDDDDDYETTFLSILDTFYEQIFYQTLLFSCFPSECRFCHCLCSPCCVVCVIPVLAGTTFREMWSFCQHELYFRVGSKFRVSSRLSCCMFLQLCGLMLSLFRSLSFRTTQSMVQTK